MTSPDGSRSPSPPYDLSPANIVGGDAAMCTPLWGMWEMWTDFPQRPPRGTSKAAAMAFFAQQQNATWLDSVKSLGIFDTVEGFWGVHDCVVAPSLLPNGGNMYLFRHCIPPMWEHEANRRGGKWVATFTPQQGEDIDRCWTQLCMAVVGEQLPGAEEEICGACVSKRKACYRLSLWTRTASDATTQKGIGFFVKVLLGLGKPGSPLSGLVLQYLEHDRVLQSHSSVPVATAEATAVPGPVESESSPSPMGEPTTPQTTRAQREEGDVQTEAKPTRLDTAALETTPQSTMKMAPPSVSPARSESLPLYSL